MRTVRLDWPDRPQLPPPPKVSPFSPVLSLPSQGLAPVQGRVRLLHGDALAVADRLLLEGRAATFDLIHLDPPFGSGADYERLRDLRVGERTVALALPAFGDTDGGDLAGYLDALFPLLHRCRELLSPHGSFWLHLDFRRGPHARLLLDEIFGADHLVNEIIWAYGLGGSSPKRFQRKHDVLYVYARDVGQHWFRPGQEAATSSMLRGQPKGATAVWQTADRDDAATLVRDWPDPVIEKTLSNRDPERTGYPTQKPLAIAARIVAASVPPGGQVLDLMSGSGTLGIAALRLGHHATLGDRSPVALDVSRGRAHALGAAVQLDTLSAMPFLKPLTTVPAQLAGTQACLLPFALPPGPLEVEGADGSDLLGAWGVAVQESEGLRAVAWWDAAAQRTRGDVQRSLPVTVAAGLVWVGIDVFGRGWQAPLA